jgi:hypothetical protein
VIWVAVSVFGVPKMHGELLLFQECYRSGSLYGTRLYRTSLPDPCPTVLKVGTIRLRLTVSQHPARDFVPPRIARSQTERKLP